MEPDEKQALEDRIARLEAVVVKLAAAVIAWRGGAHAGVCYTESFWRDEVAASVKPLV